MHTVRPGIGTQKSKRILLVAVAALIFLSVCASAIEIAALAGHDCTCTCGGLLGIGCTCGSCHAPAKAKNKEQIKYYIQDSRYCKKNQGDD